MKTKLFAAALVAALSLGAAPAAFAGDDDRGGYYGYDRRERAEITIRTHHGQTSVTRGDRLFYRLLDRPYNFRPGLIYAYSERCNQDGCDVFVFNRWSRRPIDRIFAPPLPRRLLVSQHTAGGRDWRDRGYRDSYRRDAYDRNDDQGDDDDDDDDDDHELRGGRRSEFSGNRAPNSAPN